MAICASVRAVRVKPVIRSQLVVAVTHLLRTHTLSLRRMLLCLSCKFWNLRPIAVAKCLVELSKILLALARVRDTHTAGC